MADITSPEAIAFSNTYVRSRANTLARAYYDLKKMLDEWDATNMGTLIPNSAADDIKDNAENDGRHQITGQNVHQLVETYSRAMVNDLEANNNLKLNILLSISTTAD